MDVLVIGCGNLLRGDDAAGPVCVRRMLARGLPPGVACEDGGTGGIDAVFRMRGRSEAIFVDACRSGSPPGSLFELSGDELEEAPVSAGISLHGFRWDHAVACGRALLGGECPARISACLVEGASFEPGDPLTPAVDAAVDGLVARLLDRLWNRHEAELRSAVGADWIALEGRED